MPRNRAGQRVDRVVVARYTNSGIGDHLSCLLGAWWYARCTGRTLVVDWCGSRYNEDTSHNCFTDFYTPLDQVGDVPVIADDRVKLIEYREPMYYTGKWSRAKLADPAHQPHTAEEVAALNTLVRTGEDRPEPTVVFNQSFLTLPDKAALRPMIAALTPSPTIAEAVDDFANQYLGDRKLLGIHIRHGNGENIGGRAAYWIDGLTLFRQLAMNHRNDIHRARSHSTPGGEDNRFQDNMPPSLIGTRGMMRSERKLYGKVQKVFEAFRMKNAPHPCAALLCTDSGHVVDELRKRIDALVAFDKTLLPSGEGPLHQLVQQEVDADDADGGVLVAAPVTRSAVMSRITREMFIEMELLRRCESLSCMPSQFPLLARLALPDADVHELRPRLSNRLIARGCAALMSKRK